VAKYTYVTDAVTPEERSRWLRRRHKRDAVADLPQGFSFRAQGRQGFIYYREGNRVLELYWEMSGIPEYDILLNVFGLGRWVWPSIEETPMADRGRIRQALEAWLAGSGYRAQLHEVAHDV
jgi:hypothetical protein